MWPVRGDHIETGETDGEKAVGALSRKFRSSVLHIFMFLEQIKQERVLIHVSSRFS